MTQSQKNIITQLLLGGEIAHLGPSGIRLKDSAGNPIAKLNAKTFRALRDIIKRNKKHAWVISKAAVIKLHGKTWVKKEYKRILKKNYTKATNL